jgi:hypothetical protein
MTEPPARPRPPCCQDAPSGKCPQHKAWESMPRGRRYVRGIRATVGIAPPSLRYRPGPEVERSLGLDPPGHD